MAFDYDFGSLMHYGKRTFSKNRKPTIRSIRNPNIRLGRSDGFSAMDIRKINKLYHCGSKYNTIQYNTLLNGSAIFRLIRLFFGVLIG